MFTPPVSVGSKPRLRGPEGNVFPFLIATLKMKHRQSKDLGKANVCGSIVKQLTNPGHFLMAKIYELSSSSINSLDPRILPKLNDL